MSDIIMGLLTKHVANSGNIRFILLSAIFIWGMNDIEGKINKLSAERGAYAGNVLNSWADSLPGGTDMLSSIDDLIKKNWTAQTAALSTLCNIHYEAKETNRNSSTRLDDILDKPDIKRACSKVIPR